MTTRTPSLPHREHLRVVAAPVPRAPRRARAVGAYCAGLALGFGLVAIVSAPFGPAGLTMIGAALVAAAAAGGALVVTAAWARRQRRARGPRARRPARPAPLRLAA